MTYQPSEFRRARESDRIAARRKSIWIALASTLIFALAVGFTLSRSSGLKSVQQSFFNPKFFTTWEFNKNILLGLWLNIKVMVITEIFVLIFGSLIALARTSRSPILFPVRVLAATYTDIFRGLPLLLVLYLVGFGLPGLNYSWIPISAVVLGTISLILTYTAYVAEVLRAGIEAVSGTQTMSARALGLKPWQVSRYVVFPQAVRKVIPPLLNDLISLQKDSGLISVLGAIDAIRNADILKAQFYNFTPYVVAGFFFVLLTIPLTRLADYLTAKQDKRKLSRGNW